jgi:O-antigen ligase
MPPWAPDADGGGARRLAVGALLASTLGVALVFGGSPWGPGDAVAAGLGVALLAALVAARRAGAWAPAGRIDALLALAALPLLAQLLPVPLAAWSALPARAPIAADLAAVGVAPAWMPWSLDPSGARRALLALLPGVAVFATARQASVRVAVGLAWLLLCIGAGSVLLGLAQVADGPASPLRPYAFHNLVGALGLFSYRNAHAGFLLMLFPLAFSEAIAPVPGTHAAARRWTAIVLLPLLLLGLAMTFSRAALALGVLALAGCGVLALSLRPPRASIAMRATALVLLAGMAIGAHLSLPGMAERRSEGLFDVSRIAMYRDVAAVAREYWPAGAGLGAFEQATQAIPHNVNLVGAYVNHAHNEWLQLLVELGAIGLLLALAGLAALSVAIGHAWRRPRVSPLPADLPLARAASIALALALLHAGFDYALRSGTNLAAFCVCAALLARGCRPRPPAPLA